MSAGHRVATGVFVILALLQGRSSADGSQEEKAAGYEHPSWQEQWDHMTGWDYGRMGALGVIFLIMFFNYFVPIFSTQSLIVSKSRMAIADPDANPDEVWTNLHSHGKIAAIEMAMLWVQLLCITTVGMIAFQPNCNQTLCKLLVIIFISWQPVWYLAVMGKVDDANFKRDAMFILKKESGQEIFLGVIFTWLGWFTPGSYSPSWQEQWDHMTGWDYGRMGAQGVIFLIMFFNYLIPIFGTQSLLVSKSRMAIADPDADADEVWKNMHSHGKIAAIEMAMLWVQLMCIVNVGLVAFQPSCSRAFCKVLVIIFISWQPVWYLAVVGKVDGMEVFKRDAMFILKNETGQEIFLSAIFIWLGYFAP